MQNNKYEAELMSNRLDTDHAKGINYKMGIIAYVLDIQNKISMKSLSSNANT